MKILIIGGFLGSGKTSLLLHLARYMQEKLSVERIAILENEIGQVGIDDQILRSAGYTIKGMFAGCVCCTMAGELPLTVRAMEQDLDPEWIIMEATGVAFPEHIRENLRDVLGMESRICCLVDTKRWKRLLKPMAELLPIQLSGADTVLINKTDLVDEEMLTFVKGSVAEYSGAAEIFPVCAKDGVDDAVLDKVLGVETNG